MVGLVVVFITVLVSVSGHAGLWSNSGSKFYLVGTPDTAEPSTLAPPGAKALLGYNFSYVNDFTGTSIPFG